MAYELIEQDFDAFFETPFECYGPDSPYVSPMRSDLQRFLDARRNPLFAKHGRLTYFTVQDGARRMGRIVALVHDASNHRHGLKRGYFGFFDCADDLEASRLLLTAAEDWACRQGCNEIAGNFNLTAMQQIGVVVSGFENAPYTDQLYNPPHIPALLARYGYQAMFPMATYELDLRGFEPAQLMGAKQRQLLDDPALRWERLRVHGFTRFMEDTRTVLNDGFADNPMFVPLTSEEFLFQAKEMLWILDARIAPIVYHDNQPVGVIVCIPDLNPFLRATAARLRWSTAYYFLRHWLNRRRAVVIFYSVRQSFHNRGLAGAMLATLCTNLHSAGYDSLGITWISDQNRASVRQMEKLGARVLHRTMLFRKPLVGA